MWKNMKNIYFKFNIIVPVIKKFLFIKTIHIHVFPREMVIIRKHNKFNALQFYPFVNITIKKINSNKNKHKIPFL